MTRRFYAPPEAFSPDRKSVTLGKDETGHLRDVLRLRSGDEVSVFDGTGNEFRSLVAEFDRGASRLEIIEQVEPTARESPISLTLAVALLKGEKFDLVVQKAVELGVARLVPVVTGRADVKLKSDEDALRKVTRWRRIALEATKQCGRARLMEIDAPVPFADPVHDPSTGDDLRLLFAESGGTSLAMAVDEQSHSPARLTALVGPEGGWQEEEVQSARSAGWKIITLSGRTLRAETAAITIAAIIQHRFGDLK